MLQVRTLVVGTLGLLSAVAIGGCLGSRSIDRKLIGQTAPDFTLTDLEGNAVSLAEQRGKVVLLAFWAYG